MNLLKFGALTVQFNKKRKMIKLFFFIVFFAFTLPTNDAKSSNSFEFKFETLTSNQLQLLHYVEQIFCKIQSIFVNISVEKSVSEVFSSHLIKKLTSCSACGIMINRLVFENIFK